MKTKSLFFAALVVVSTTAFAFGNDAPGMTVVSMKGSEVFKVIYQGTTPGKVRLNVFNPQGKKIHSETISGLDGFICPLNFKGLESGNYTIEVVDDAGRYQEEVVYRPVDEMKSVHVSKLLGSEGKFLLAIANAQNEAIRVTIFDDAQRVLHSESKTIAGDFAQVYRLENFPGGYTFEISDAAGNKKYFSF